MGHIVVGFDGSAQSVRALEWAKAEARLRKVPLIVAEAWELPMTPLMSSAEVPLEVDYADQVKAHAIEVLESAQMPDDLEVHRVVIEGHPSTALLAEAKGADLLVLGSSGHGEVAGMLFGSVALHAVTHAPCPVVIVRGDD